MFPQIQHEQSHEHLREDSWPALANYCRSLHRVSASCFLLSLLIVLPHNQHTHTPHCPLYIRYVILHNATRMTFDLTSVEMVFDAVGTSQSHMYRMGTDRLVNLGKGKTSILQEETLMCVTTSHFHHTPWSVTFILNYRAINQLTISDNSGRMR